MRRVKSGIVSAHVKEGACVNTLFGFRLLSSWVDHGTAAESVIGVAPVPACGGGRGRGCGATSHRRGWWCWESRRKSAVAVMAGWVVDAEWVIVGVEER